MRQEWRLGLGLKTWSSNYSTLQILASPHLPAFEAQVEAAQISEQGPEKSADEMGGLGDIVALEHGRNFLGQIQQKYQDKGERYFPTLVIDKTAEQDEHEDNAAGPHQSRREEDRIEETGGQGRDKPHDEQIATTVFFLKYGANQKNDGKITRQMIEVAMPQYMGEKTAIIEGILPIEMRR